MEYQCKWEYIGSEPSKEGFNWWHILKQYLKNANFAFIWIEIYKCKYFSLLKVKCFKFLKWEIPRQMQESLYIKLRIIFTPNFEIVFSFILYWSNHLPIVCDILKLKTSKKNCQPLFWICVCFILTLVIAILPGTIWLANIGNLAGLIIAC